MNQVLNDTIKMVDTKQEIIHNLSLKIAEMTRKEVKAQLISNCSQQIGKLTNRNWAAVLGYCVKLAEGATVNNDGSISYCGFFEHRNNEQHVAERTMDNAIRELTKQTISGRA